MIAVQYDDGGVQRSLELGIEALSDLKPIFLIYLKWLRPDIRKVFSDNNWEPLDEATLAHRRAHQEALNARIRAGAIRGLSERLGRERARAEKRYHTATYKHFTQPGVKAAKAFARTGKVLLRHDVVRAEFERIKAGTGGAVDPQAKRLPERIIRAGIRAGNKIAASESGAPIGRLENGFGADIDKNSLAYFHHWDKAGVHNEGATVAHGAHVPKREFLAWNPERIAKLAEIAAIYVANKIKK